ncbi:sensor histidine kinase [Roseateles aquatilis]|nr:ATP-binding protein [Roseateles aquatilis]
MRFAKIPWPASLRGRLFAVFVFGMVLSAALVGLLYVSLHDTFYREVRQGIAHHYAEEVAEFVRFDAQGRPRGLDETVVEPWLFDSFSEEAKLRVLTPEGRVVFATDPDPSPRAFAPEGQPFDPARESFPMLHQGVPMHAATVPLIHEGRRWLLQLAVSDRMMQSMQLSFGAPALRQGVVALCVVFLVVFFVTMHVTLRHALRPLRQASAAARRISPRSLDRRLEEADQPLEIRPLVQGFNQALDRLQRGFRAQQEFLASAAHELKTPLALIRAQVELGIAEPERGQLLEDVDRVARQVQQLLLLAEASEPENYRIERIDPRPALQEVFDFMDRVAARRQVRLGIRVDPALRTWDVDRGALFTLLKNLLENAIQHSPVGAAVWLTAEPRRFSVSDQGGGVAPKDLPRIFERFWRGEDRRDDGAGLGLSICTEIATAHGWRLSAAPGAEGLVVTCRLDSDETTSSSAQATEERWEETVAERLPSPPLPLHLRPTAHIIRDVLF